MINYEWDEAKRIGNLDLHKLDFADAQEFDWESALVARDDRQDYGEGRYIALGKFLERLTVLVFTNRGNSIRIISWRKANQRESKAYEACIQNQS
jgi:uncharacterized DUF497 family protein